MRICGSDPHSFESVKASACSFSFFLKMGKNE